MPNAVSTIFAVILSVLVMFYVPTYQNYKKQEDLSYLNTYQVVTDFVDNVRTKGFITPDMFEEFQSKLAVGDVLYDFEMVHQHKIYSPIYSEPSNKNSFTGEYDVQYDEYYWEQIKEVLYGDSSVPLDERIYKLETGDFFYIYVENSTKFKSTMLFDLLTAGIGDSDNVVVSIPYGGRVMNEDY